MKTILLWLDRHFEDCVCGALLLLMMCMLLAQVFVRAFFGHGLTISEEISRFSFLYLVYIASSLVASKGAHIRVTAHMRYLPRAVSTLMLALADLLWLTFNAVVIWQGSLLIRSMGEYPMISGSLLIDLRPIYVILPIAFALQSFRVLQRWYRIATGKAMLLPADGGEVL